MTIFGKRNGQSAVGLKGASMASTFEQDTSGPPRPTPAPRLNPLDPYVATLTSAAIIQAEEHHIAEVDAAISHAEDVARQMRANFPAWAEGRLAAARARAEDVATGHAEILRCKEAFDAIRSGKLPALEDARPEIAKELGEFLPLPPGDYVLETTVDGDTRVAEGPFRGRHISLSAFKGRFPGEGKWTAKVGVERDELLPDAGPALADVADARRRLEDLAQRLEATRPGDMP